jgi:hypothetical protein
VTKTKKRDILKEIKRAIESSNYIYTSHANKRIKQREVTRFEVKQVLLSGHHEKRKDSFDEEWNSWHYSIKGKTLDKKNLRVVVSFDENNMLIITVIDLDR